MPPVTLGPLPEFKSIQNPTLAYGAKHSLGAFGILAMSGTFHYITLHFCPCLIGRAQREGWSDDNSLVANLDDRRE